MRATLQLRSKPSDSAARIRSCLRASALFVDFPSMSQCNEEQLVLHEIKLVNHPIIPHAQPISIRSLHAVVRKVEQTSSNRIDFLLKAILDVSGQCRKALIESMRINLSSRSPAGPAHGLRVRVLPAAISALPEAISSLNASVISRRSSNRFSSQSRNSCCSSGRSFSTASSTFSRLLILRETTPCQRPNQRETWSRPYTAISGGSGGARLSQPLRYPTSSASRFAWGLSFSNPLRLRQPRSRRLY